MKIPPNVLVEVLHTVIGAIQASGNDDIEIPPSIAKWAAQWVLRHPETIVGESALRLLIAGEEVKS